MVKDRWLKISEVEPNNTYVSHLYSSDGINNDKNNILSVKIAVVSAFNCHQYQVKKVFNDQTYAYGTWVLKNKKNGQ